MKTLKCKPSLEVLEDRLAMFSSGGGLMPTESLSITFGGTLQGETEYLDFNGDGRPDLVGDPSRLNGLGFGGLGFIEQDNLYKFRASMILGTGDGSFQPQAGLMGSAEYLRGGNSFMIGEDIPDADRFQEKPPSILIGLLLP